MVRFLSNIIWIIACSILQLGLFHHNTFAQDASPSIKASQDDEFFESKVRPLLVEHCYECHGPNKQWNNLRLDSRDSVLQGGDSGTALVPGNTKESLLVKAIRHEGDLQMPPEKKLSDQAIANIELWIASGAAWPKESNDSKTERLKKQREHWAFQPIARIEPPKAVDSAWCKTEIDYFLLNRLEANQLRPSPEADKRTLIRRATMDLLGIPPTMEEVNDFVHDPREDAYPRLIDRLLDSPHYGEQWARHWLDVARYSDTKGYVYGREERFFTHASTYRDWVVDAFNRDLPYNRFLSLQIAADQIAPEDEASQAAMGFLTLGRRFLGVTHDIIDDRIDVVTRGTMGLTVGCARCHDHKYDPIPTADYYSLYGVFQNSHEVSLAMSKKEEPTDDYRTFAAEWTKRKQAFDEKLKAARKEASDRVRSRLADYLFAQTELHKYPEEGFDVVISITDLNPTFIRRWERYLAHAKVIDDPLFRIWRAYAAIPADAFPKLAGEKTKEILDFAPGDRMGIPEQIWEEFQTVPLTKQEVADRYAKAFQKVMEPSTGDREPTSPTNRMRAVLFGVDSPCEVPDEGVVSTEFYFDSAMCVELWKLQGEVDRWVNQSNLAPAHAVVLRDRASLVEPRVFKRGNPANRSEEISRHFLSSLSDARPFQQGSGRKELAESIVDPKNPLTARVWINRVWMHHFGNGLVRTASDFGLRSDIPSHPQLLDWLANTLIDSGWSTKTIHRKLMLSATYRQQSYVPNNDSNMERAKTIDPENRWLWRMNPRRLSFEEMRDSMLVVAGELDPRRGGRSSDLFAGNHARRTLYGLVDRQFLPGTMRYFDFANPDLHIPTRNETIVPQQALFAMNHPFMAKRAEGLLSRSLKQCGLDADLEGLHDRRNPAWSQDNQRRAITAMMNNAFQRSPSEREMSNTINFLLTDTELLPQVSEESKAWQYGYGEIDPMEGKLKSFVPLPYFTGFSWQGGPSFPDGPLGWVQITATGGHPGNDLQHAIVRRWKASSAGKIRIHSKVLHEPEVGDGVRCWILSSRHGKLATVDVHHREASLDVNEVEVESGDTIDFVVDILKELNSDQHFWRVKVEPLGSQTTLHTDWNSERDFVGPHKHRLSTWAQLSQMFLMSNEFYFVD